jgi:hypothetical protein
MLKRCYTVKLQPAPIAQSPVAQHHMLRPVPWDDVDERMRQLRSSIGCIARPVKEVRLTGHIDGVDSYWLNECSIGPLFVTLGCNAHRRIHYHARFATAPISVGVVADCHRDRDGFDDLYALTASRHLRCGEEVEVLGGVEYDAPVTGMKIRTGRFGGYWSFATRLSGRCQHFEMGCNTATAHYHAQFEHPKNTARLFFSTTFTHRWKWLSQSQCSAVARYCAADPLSITLLFEQSVSSLKTKLRFEGSRKHANLQLQMGSFFGDTFVAVHTGKTWRSPADGPPKRWDGIGFTILIA